MSAPDHPFPTEAPPPSPDLAGVRASGRWRTAGQALRGLGWLGHWLPGAALALVLAGGVAGWVWAGSDGSLTRALGWAQDWMADAASPAGRLQASGAQGSLRAGGRVQELHWTRQGLDVRLQGVQLEWTGAQLVDALLGRGLRLQGLHLDRVTVDDQREASPTQPLASLTLPLRLDLPWSVGQLRITGRQPLALDGARGHYRYGPAYAAARQAWGPASLVTDAHHLRVDALTLAQGQYQLQAVLGAQAPMPLQLTAQGRVLTSVPGGHSVSLQASASATGTLAGQSATLAVQGQVQATDSGGTPTLVAHAQVQPWAARPLHTVNAQAHRLDLAALWPQAPVTALSGTVQASPDAGGWRAQANLRNERSGPWDQQRLPLDALTATVEQHGTEWRVPVLSAQLGRSMARGQGQYQPASGGTAAQWQGQLQATALNPALVWSSLAPTSLDLTATARRTSRSPGAIELGAQVQSARGDPGRGSGLPLRELRLKGLWQGGTGPDARGGGTLRLDEALLDAAQARLNAQGTLDLTATTFSGSTTLQLPGAQGQWSGLLGHASGQGDLTLRVDSADRLLDWAHSLQSLPVVGPALRDTLARNPALRDLSLDGQASLQAQWRGGLGPLGYPAPRAGVRAVEPLQLQATLDIPRLSSASRRPAAGAGGLPTAWSLRGVQLRASGGLADLTLAMRGEGAQGPWSGTWQLQGRAQQLWPLPGPADVAGRLTLDSLSLRASDASRPDRVVDWALRSTQPFDMSARALPDGLALQAGAHPLQLQLQPSVRSTGSRATVSTLAPLTLAWDSLAWQAGTLQTRGRLNGLPLAWVETLGRAEGADSGPLTQAGLRGDMVFDGDWDLLLPLQAADQVRLTANLQRRSGDLALISDPDAIASGPRGAGSTLLQGGVREAILGITVQGRRATARMRWDSERLGQASADFGTELSATPPSDGPWLDRWWPSGSPLTGTLSARLPQADVWSALAPPGWRMRGTLRADATLGGTRAEPNWRGTLQGDQLALRSVVDGFEFTQGQLQATLNGDRLSIDRFDIKSPLGGSLSASGQAQWRLLDGLRQPLIDLQVRANSVRISNRADRRLTLSGQVTAQLSGPKLSIRGQLNADSALFVLPDEATPTLGTDVVVRGGRNLPQGTGTVARVEPDVSVDLNLGQQFEVRGRGLRARLTGQLNLRSTPAVPAPRVFGEVRTASGSYRAYGQQLTIENGLLLFNGPYDDPTLDILAIRPQGSNTSQRVGVQINGSAQEPRLRLVATPDLSDSDKLAWLVLGRPATGSGAEAAVLQQAALALLAGNDGALNGGLAQALGLDEISYRGETTNTDGSTSAAAVTLGKRISNQLYLSYETGLAGAMGTVSVFYDVSRRFTLRARAGEENALDLIFTLQYD